MNWIKQLCVCVWGSLGSASTGIVPGTSLCLTSYVNAYISFGSLTSLCGTAWLYVGLLAKFSAGAQLSALGATAWCTHGISVAESSIRAVRGQIVILDTLPLPRKLEHKPRSQLLLSCPCSVYWAESAPADSSSKFLAAHIYLVAFTICVSSVSADFLTGRWSMVQKYHCINKPPSWQWAWFCGGFMKVLGMSRAWKLGFILPCWRWSIRIRVIQGHMGVLLMPSHE